MRSMRSLVNKLRMQSRRPRQNRYMVNEMGTDLFSSRPRQRQGENRSVPISTAHFATPCDSQRAHRRDPVNDTPTTLISADALDSGI